MQQQLTRVRGSWDSLPVRARYALIAVAIVALLVVALVVRSATSTTWVPVASDLSSDKLGQAQSTLEAQGIQNQLGPNGSSILVPTDMQAKAAALLVPAGITSKGGRIDCAKKVESGGNSLVMQGTAQTELMIKTCNINDVENIIENIDGVQHANVVVTQPKAELFSQDQQAPKAAVQIDTSGNGLPAKSVTGIQSLVANAFDGLKRDEVTVTDESGAVISSNFDSSSGSAMAGNMSPTEKLAIQQQMNQAAKAELTSTLEQVAGKGKVKIIPNLQINMDQKQTKTYTPTAAGKDGQQIAANESAKQEILDGAAQSGVQGIAGTGTNNSSPADRRTTATDTTTGTGKDNGYLNNDRQTNYDNAKVEELIYAAPGSIDAYHISVIVDESVPASAQQAIKDGVQAWMGGNPDNSFSFDTAKFASAGSSKATMSATQKAVAGYLKWALLGIALIGLAFVLRRSLTRRTAELLAPADDLLLIDSGDFTPIPIAELEAALAAGQPNADKRERIEMQRKVEQIAQNKPHDVANELRRWMQQEDPAFSQRQNVRRAG